jgi:hypothetical protein
MKRPRLKSFILILSLIVVTGAAMAYTGRGKPAAPQPPPPPPIVFSGGGILNLSGHLVQTHVLKGSPGRVSLPAVKRIPPAIAASISSLSWTAAAPCRARSWSMPASPC